ncbi:hypothetical protein QFC24_002660 [Naganishia onofrii]|uniref:Uncharacterized protein n=1 Tax=Naganishia onofrii TaxID=1851511 RepID=A0ACC2XS93_9TREE|nr:hypothetical protein QFC24_002660 [Naganishia onofrii]
MSSRLSPAIKALIAGPHSVGSPLPSPGKAIADKLFGSISSKASSVGLAKEAWIVLTTAALVTTNSPPALCDLYSFAAKDATSVAGQARVAAIMRETGIKCIGFSGTINALGALRTHLPEEVKSALSTEPLRTPSPDNVMAAGARGKALWDAIYQPYSDKLIAKLAESHPDLPVHILHAHYGHMFADPLKTFPEGHFKVGRVLTSVVAMSCLKAQQGVAAQLTSHVYGLKKSLQEGGGAEGEEPIKGQEWLVSDEGVEWILRTVEEVCKTINPAWERSEGQIKAKL